MVRLQRKSIRHKHAYLRTYLPTYLLHGRGDEARDGLWALSPCLRPNSVHDGDGLLKWRLSKCGGGPFAALQLPDGSPLLAAS